MNEKVNHTAEDLELIDALDRLARSERSIPGADFESRLAHETFAGEPAVIAVRSRSWWRGSLVRVAAAVALGAGGFLAWSAWRGAAVPSRPGAGAVAAATEGWSDEEWDSTFTVVLAAMDGGTSDTIDDLVRDTAELGTRVDAAKNTWEGDTL